MAAAGKDMADGMRDTSGQRSACGYGHDHILLAMQDKRRHGNAIELPAKIHAVQ
jgi:hypothetical protein